MAGSKSGGGRGSKATAAARRLPDFHTAPGHLFRRGRQFHDALWLRYIGPGLTPLQYAVLTALELEAGIDQQTLGERIALDKSTIGDIIGRLTGRGLIRRGDDPADARRKLLYITDPGREILFETAPIVERIGQEILEPLSPKEREQLLVLVNKLVYSDEAARLSVARGSSRGSGSRGNAPKANGSSKGNGEQAAGSTAKPTRSRRSSSSS